MRPLFRIVLLSTLAACSTHLNAVRFADHLGQRLDPVCVQTVIRDIPGSKPNPDPVRWWTNARMSGNEFWSSYDFSLPDVENLPGPRGEATYGVTEFFERSKEPSNLFIGVVWTEPYPQSEANAVRPLRSRCGTSATAFSPRATGTRRGPQNASALMNTSFQFSRDLAAL
jgi:hypothetical protein